VTGKNGKGSQEVALEYTTLRFFVENIDDDDHKRVIVLIEESIREFKKKDAVVLYVVFRLVSVLFVLRQRDVWSGLIELRCMQFKDWTTICRHSALRHSQLIKELGYYLLKDGTNLLLYRLTRNRR